MFEVQHRTFQQNFQNPGFLSSYCGNRYTSFKRKQIAWPIIIFYFLIQIAVWTKNIAKNINTFRYRLYQTGAIIRIVKNAVKAFWSEYSDQCRGTLYLWFQNVYRQNFILFRNTYNYHEWLQFAADRDSSTSPQLSKLSSTHKTAIGQ